VHLFPVLDPDEGTSGVLGVAWVVPGSGRDREAVRDRGARDVVLGELALMALRSAEAGPLLEAAARLLHRALDAESCAVSEYLPGDGGLLVRASVGMSPSAPPLVSSPGVSAVVSGPATSGPQDMPDGWLEVPIGGPPAFGRLEVRLRPGRRFSPEDKGFVLAAAEIVSAALMRLAADEQRKRAAVHDPLTGLPLPTLIHDHLRQALARSRRQGSQVGLLVVDLDGFKMVNDTLGRRAGDELLVAVAQRLLTTLRPSDSLGRLDGDQFMVVCEDLGGVADARAVAARLATAFQKPFHLNRSEVSVTASIGGSLAGDATDPFVLRAEADAAMHQAKLVDGPSVVLNEGMRPTGAAAQQ
jgi:diguanylate cyclase (GGDEF)-like protein